MIGFPTIMNCKKSIIPIFLEKQNCGIDRWKGEHLYFIRKFCLNFYFSTPLCFKCLSLKFQYTCGQGNWVGYRDKKKIAFVRWKIVCQQKLQVLQG